jgi:hypothetical protein
LREIAARPVSYQVPDGAGQPEIEPAYSTDPDTRYARVRMLVTALVLLLVIVAKVSTESASIH